MGSLVNFMPVTITYFNIANLALCGIPFLAGFYSKDLILEIVLLSNINIFRFLLYFVSTGLTVCYSFRLIYYRLRGDFNFFRIHIINDEGYTILKSMRGLIIIRLLGGRILRWLIFPNPDIICIPLIIKLLILFTCITGGIIGYLISNVSLYFNNKIKNFNLVRRFLGDIWFIPLIFTCGISFTPLKYRIIIKKRLDGGWKEFLGGQKIYLRIKNSSIIFNVLNNNYFKIYFLLFFIWFIFLFIFMIYLNSLKRALHWRCKGDCYNL